MMAALKKLLKNNMLIVIALISLIYFAPAMYRPAQSNEKAIITAFGIDKKGDEYEVSTLVVIPTAEKTDSTNSVELVSATGKSLGDAINQISLDVGKSLGLAHCDSIIINDDALSVDLHSTLDFLNRSGELTKNAMLFNTPDSSKDILNTLIATKIIPALKISTMVEYNKESFISREASIDGFYAEYFTPCSVSMLPIIDLKPSYTKPQEEGSQGSSNSQAKAIECSGDICVLKQGKKVATLQGDCLTSYNALKNSIKTGYLCVDGVNGGIYNDARLMLEIRNKKLNKKTQFIDGVPTITYKGSILLRVVEINNHNNDLDAITEVNNNVTDVVKNKLLEDIKTSLSNTMEIAIQNNVDFFEYDNLFSAKKPNEWNSFKQKHPEPSDYLQHIDINFDIKIDGKF